MRHLIFLSLLISSLASAGQRYKIVYELFGEQVAVEVEQNGGVTTDATVIWDERVDGPLPKDAPVGFADRVVDRPTGKVSLVLNPAKKAALDDKEKKKSDADAVKADCQTLKARIGSGKSQAGDTDKAAACWAIGL